MTAPAFRKEKAWYFPDVGSIYQENVEAAFDTQEERWAFVGNYKHEHKPLSQADYPNYLYIDRRLSDAHMRQMPDILTTRTGAWVVRERFVEILSGFDLGATQLIEFPMRGFDQETVQPERYWLLNICEIKDTLSVEHSDTSPDPEEWRALKRYKGDHIKGDRFFYAGEMQNEVKPQHHIVLTEPALEGADLWFEQKLSGFSGFFTSARLAAAIKDGRVKARRVPKKISVRILREAVT